MSSTSLTGRYSKLRISGKSMCFVTKQVPAPSPILSEAVDELQGLDSADSVTAAEPAQFAANTVVGGTLIAKAASYPVAARPAVVTGRSKGRSRAERSCIRGHSVSPMTALVLAAAIALSPLANDPTQVIRQCIWHIHVVLCRWRDVDPPPVRKGKEPTTTDSDPVNWVAQTASYEISVSAATHFASPVGPGPAAAEVVNARAM